MNTFIIYHTHIYTLNEFIYCLTFSLMIFFHLFAKNYWMIIQILCVASQSFFIHWLIYTSFLLFLLSFDVHSSIFNRNGTKFQHIVADQYHEQEDILWKIKQLLMIYVVMYHILVQLHQREVNQGNSSD